MDLTNLDTLAGPMGRNLQKGLLSFWLLLCWPSARPTHTR